MPLPDLPPLELAYYQYETSLKELFYKNDISNKNFDLFIRAFKKEQKLEVFAKDRSKGSFIKLRDYDFCSSSGKLGPKRKEGDFQIPEGIYHINRFNPKSKFHLSLGLNYPNKSDRIFGDSENPGTDIFIHGGCRTIGCISITDEKIRELYLLAEFAKNGGQHKIPVHFFPFKMTDSNLKLFKKNNLEHFKLWKSLQKFYTEFEENMQVLRFSIDEYGYYQSL